MSELIGGRYQRLSLAGEGGVATVYRVQDTVTGGTVALKRLKVDDDPGRAKTVLQLFEREYHTLSQLSHPRIVEVYAYHVDPQGAFYTMELLDGGNLRSLSPLQPQRACVLMRDVCSALCLIHSRRLVHRDISPRNVHCSADGLAKLIDFGALMGMDASARPVGTPPFCAPEVVDMEPLDARADLYSLGTSLYFMLTGRHAYPAANFRELREVWQVPPPPPSQLQAGIPPELDDLVLELIQLDRRGRPAQAAEVMERLSAIGGVALDEHLVVSQAYLNTPSLIGRDRKVAQLRERLRELKQGQGGSLLIEADWGLGRSRLVGACSLEAALLGLTVATVHASDGLPGEGEASRFVARQLLGPEAGRAQTSSGTPLADLPPPSQPPLGNNAAGPQVSATQPWQHLRQQLLELCKKQPIALLIDDFDQLDEASAKLFALLATDAAKHPLFVLATANRQRGDDLPALTLLRQLATNLTLRPLTHGETRKLLASVFGEVPNLRLVSDRFHHVAAGNPRDLIQLARHLVDRGLAKYHAGSWSLPDRIDPGDLPASFSLTLQDRVAQLSARARKLAHLFALAPDFEWSVSQCAEVSGQARGGELLAALDELVASGIICQRGSRYLLDRTAWIAPLCKELTSSDEASIHRSIAALFERLDMAAFVGRHLLAAGEDHMGLDVLVEHARATKLLTDQDVNYWRRFAKQLPQDYCETMKAAVELCQPLGRPQADRHALQARLSSVLVFNGHNARNEMQAVLAQCEHDAGLDIYAQLDELEEPGRLQESFARAQARHDALPESARVFAPLQALKPLVSSLLECVGFASNANDHAMWEQLPSLAPFVGLAPSFPVMEQVRTSAGHRLAGRYLRAQQGYDEAVERLQQPDRAGLPEAYWHALYDGVLFARALADVFRGGRSSAEAADGLTDDRGGLGAIRLRKLHCLWRGDGEAADRLGQAFEIARLETGGYLHHEGGLLFAEVWALACSDDLNRLRRVMPQVERWSQRGWGWEAVLSFARGQQCRIRGDWTGALEHTSQALEKTACGQHPLWPALAGAEVLCLRRLDSEQNAKHRGLAHRATAESQGLDFGLSWIDLPLSESVSALGEHAEAREIATRVVTRLLDQGTEGLLLRLAYLNLASVCLNAEDEGGFQDAAAKCAEQFEGSGGALSANYRRLMRSARKRLLPPETSEPTAPPWSGADAATHLTTMFDSCHTVVARAQVAGQLLAECCGAEQVFIYLPDENGPRLGASFGYCDPPAQLEALVGDYLEAVLAQEHEATMTCADEDTRIDVEPPLLVGDRGQHYHGMVLGHVDQDRFVVTAVAALVLGAGEIFVRPAQLATQMSRIGLAREHSA